MAPCDWDPKSVLEHALKRAITIRAKAVLSPRFIGRVKNMLIPFYGYGLTLTSLFPGRILQFDYRFRAH